ncbi:hypothetical protein CI109_103692 [Kwoniella shandongensis]|uniref:Uncharacterized protein n=1 Tax=Kwoniella shandongensis TaxID=1734106 RepID=A0A5M6CB89_9TREE|nr:uncharacterized protein CI109_000614 [Kwoniella shandongensis]KAA5531042.1 hypothetical protein CI109_000614 [Kwoniella shandongensis]
MACLFPSSRKPVFGDSPKYGAIALPIESEKSVGQLEVEPPAYETISDDDLQVRLRDLRKEIDDEKLDWYVVPSEDEHQSEEVGPSEKRRAFISGFTGSAGTAVIPSNSTSSPALLFVDSRYWIQAEKQIPEGWEVVRVGASGISGREDVIGGWIDWVTKGIDDGARVGIDPKLLSLTLARSIKSRLSDAGSSTKLVPISANLVDRIQTPVPRSLGPILPHPLDFAGEDTPSKLARVRSALSDSFAASQPSSSKTKTEWIYLLPSLPSIAWLLNYRCPTDVPFCPVAYAYLVLTEEKCVIFVDERKVEDEELRDRWQNEGVEVRSYGVNEVGKYVKIFKAELKAQLDEKDKVNTKILAPAECSWALAEACSPSAVEIIPCPVDKLKAIKNPVEQQGYRNAYLRDGRAMVRWMAWLEKTILKEERKVGEWAAAQTLTRYRAKEEHFAGLAYQDISGSGPNGALPHYAPERGKDRLIDLETPYVIDSGAQYLDGTIDTTRTLFLGKDASPDIKRAYTRVLQGHLAVSTAVFPRGMPADRLSMLAKAPLYQDGLDFGHGIGHGVGSYLGVHETPFFPKNDSLVPGHVTTIEPGYYKEGEWGMRIESVLLCNPVDTMYETTGHFLTFERITQVPIQTTLVDWSLLSKTEMRWINDHNKAVEDVLMPLLQADEDGDARDWLKRTCKPHKIWPWSGV